MIDVKSLKRSRPTSNTPSPTLTNGTRDSCEISTEQTPKDKLDQLIQSLALEEKNKQEGGHKRVKTDWFESFEEVQSYNDKSKYEKIKEIGDGTYSRVISAKNRETGDLVAIKKLYMNRDPINLSLLREITCLMTCSHVNIVKFIEVLITMSKLGHKKISIVTELCETDLYSLNRKRFPLGREHYKDFFHQMLVGIQYLHSINLVHRDVKLSNYLITADGIVKLGDFGLGKNFLNEMAPHSPAVVTLCYRAPELILSDREYTTAIDIWSLGCCLAELIIGETLFSSPRSEIDQLLKIFAMFGVDGEDEMFQNSTLTFPKKPASNWKEDIMGDATETELQILEGCFLYGKTKRLTATQLLENSYWKEQPEMKRYIYANFNDNPVVKKSRYDTDDDEEECNESWHGASGRPLFGKRLQFDSPTDTTNVIWNNNSCGQSSSETDHTTPQAHVNSPLLIRSPKTQQNKPRIKQNQNEENKQEQEEEEVDEEEEEEEELEEKQGLYNNSNNNNKQKYQSAPLQEKENEPPQKLYRK
jgi:serine/threonine protein kinase